MAYKPGTPREEGSFLINLNRQELGRQKDIDELLEELRDVRRSLPLNSWILSRLLLDKEMLGDESQQEHAVTNEDINALWQKIRAEWMEKTHVLDAYEQDGADLFAPDLTQQPNFPQLEKISFLGLTNNTRIPDLFDKAGVTLQNGTLTSVCEQLRTYLRHERSQHTIAELAHFLSDYGIRCDDEFDFQALMKFLRRGGEVDGYYYPMEKRITIADVQPSLQVRLWSIIGNGELHPVAETLGHEIRHHKYHEREQNSRGVERLREFDEALAWYWHPFNKTKEGMINMIEGLSAEDGCYKFDRERVLQAVVGVETLAGLGLGQAEMTKLIMTANWNTQRKIYPEIDAYIQAYMARKGLDDEDVEALRDRAYLQRKVDTLKAQKIGQEVILQTMGEKRINQNIRAAGPIVALAFDVESGDIMKNAVTVCPNNDQSPYSINIRSGYMLRVWDNGPSVQIVHVERTTNSMLQQKIEDVPAAEQPAVEHEVQNILRSHKNLFTLRLAFWRYPKLRNHPLLAEFADEVLATKNEEAVRKS